MTIIDLPAEILTNIYNKLDILDKIYFTRVCKHFYTCKLLTNPPNILDSSQAFCMKFDYMYKDKLRKMGFDSPYEFRKLMKENRIQILAIYNQNINVHYVHHTDSIIKNVVSGNADDFQYQILADNIGNIRSIYDTSFESTTPVMQVKDIHIPERCKCSQCTKIEFIYASLDL